jgi:ribonuclease HI
MLASFARLMMLSLRGARAISGNSVMMSMRMSLIGVGLSGCSTMIWAMKKVLIYTDGSSRGNPGPGGYGALLMSGEHRKEMSGGYKETTNNRMELLAVIKALESLKMPCEVVVISDSRYVINAMTKGWMKGWCARGWTKADKKPLKNVDLWKRLHDAEKAHHMQWKWVKGHAGNEYNECCDRLATSAAMGENLPLDEGYVAEGGDPDLFTSL